MKEEWLGEAFSDEIRTYRSTVISFEVCYGTIRLIAQQGLGKPCDDQREDQATEQH